MGRKYQSSTNLRYALQNISSKIDTLLSALVCKFCHAKKFHHESKGFCCADGEISLVSSDVPNEFYELFTSNLEELMEFLKYVCTFNNKVALMSYGVKYDKNLCRETKGYICSEFRVKSIIISMTYCH